MNKKIISKVVASAVLCSMVGYTAPVFAYTKDETVYSKLDASGNSYKTIVSTHIENSDNRDTITDLSDLLNIKNTNGEETFTQNGSTFTWNANKKDIYYQGESSKDLPVQCKIKYELDGEEIEAKDIAGKSGKVKITLEYTNKEERTVRVNGKNVKMYVPFVVMAGTIIDNENAENVEVSSGKVINDGSKTIVAGIAMPGLQESLGVSEKDIEIPNNVEITMDAKNFETSTITTYITPTVLEEDDLKVFDKLDEMYSKINTLQDASKQLVDGTAQLKDGANQLNDGANQLSSALDSKMTQYYGIRNKISNKEAVKKQIINVINKEMEKMLPDIEAQAKIEAQNAIKNHQTELENSVVDTSMKYTKMAVNQKLAEIEKNGGRVLTEEQEKQLEEALAKDIKTVYANAKQDPQISALLAELESDMKKEAKNTVNTVIDSKKVNAATLTPAQMQAYAKAYATQIAQIKAINPSITDVQALQIIGVVSNSTLSSVENEIDTKIDSISSKYATQIEQKIKAELNTYISKVTQDVADTFTKGNTEILKQYEKQIQNNIVAQLKAQLSQDKVLNAYGNKAKVELNKTIDGVANKTAEELAGKYTATIASEVANNLIEKQLNGGLADTEIDKELSKYEQLINSKLNEADKGIAELKSALKQLTDGTEQLAEGSNKLADGMQQFNKDGIEKICNFIKGDVKDVADRADKLTELANDYNNFTMLENGNEGNVKFILLIDGVKKEEE